MNREVYNCSVATTSGKTKEFIDFTEMPSLKQMAVVSFAINLWSEPDTTKALKEHCLLDNSTTTNLDDENGFTKIVDIVNEKLSRVHMPRSLIDDTSEIVRPIGLQMLHSFEDRKKYPNIYDVSGFGHTLSWTNEGVVDEMNALKTMKKKNAEDFNELLRTWIQGNVIDSFPFIFKQWMVLLQIEKDLESNENDIKATHKVLMSLNLHNIYGVKHYWTKLSEKEKDENSLDWLSCVIAFQKFRFNSYKYQEYVANTDVMLFLLSSSERYQKGVFQAFPEIILKCLFYVWPFQRFFLPTLTVMFEYLLEDVYIKIMTCVASEIRIDRKENLLFRTIWSRSPLRLKEPYLRDLTRMTKAIWCLLFLGDLKTIRIILNEAAPELQREIVLNMIDLEHKSLFENILHANKMNFLKTLITDVLFIDDVKSFEENMVSVFGAKFPHQSIS